MVIVAIVHYYVCAVGGTLNSNYALFNLVTLNFRTISFTNFYPWAVDVLNLKS
jgi:hypothetical protein